MMFQKSVFMAWGHEKISFEEFKNMNIKEYTKSIKDEYLNNPICICKKHNSFLLKLVIDKQRKKDILEQLDICGINQYTIYPTLDNVGKYVDKSNQFDIDKIGF